jgi:hypothetical protein
MGKRNPDYESLDSRLNREERLGTEAIVCEEFGITAEELAAARAARTAPAAPEGKKRRFVRK